MCSQCVPCVSEESHIYKLWGDRAKKTDKMNDFAISMEALNSDGPETTSRGKINIDKKQSALVCDLHLKET